MAKTPIEFLNQTPRIVIVGVGLLGGSLGLALKKAGYTGRIIGVGRRQASLDIALTNQCVDQVALLGQNIWQTDEPTLAILATPICTFREYFSDIAQARPTNLTLTDAGSTKAEVCQWAQAILPDPARFVGAHPMAGSEKQGPSHAWADLFQHRPAILTPTDQTAPAALAQVTALWQAVGMRIVRMTPADHDHAVAAISHLPHALAVLIVLGAAESPGAMDIAAGGFRDTTRVASGDVSVWLDILMTNRQALLSHIDRFQADLATLRQALHEGDQAALHDHLQKAKTVRDDWLEQHGRSLPAPPAGNTE